MSVKLSLLWNPKTRGAYEEMILTLQQLSVEMENGVEEMKKETEKLKLEAEASRIALEEADKKLRVALEEAEAEAAKETETQALNQIKMLCDRTNAARASTPKSGTDITISSKVESLRNKVEELNNIAEMKVAAAMARVEAVKASEYEALKRFGYSERIQRHEDRYRGCFEVRRDLWSRKGGGSRATKVARKGTEESS